MGKFDKIKYFLGSLKRNWKTKYRLVVRNVLTHQDRISILLSPRNIFVLVMTSAFVLIMLTIFLIAFTPLRVYVPGYTNPDNYKELKTIALQIDSLEHRFKINQDYIDNFYYILSEEIPEGKDDLTQKVSSDSKKDKSETDKKKVAEAKEVLYEEAEMILKDREDHPVAGATSMPISKLAGTNTLLLLPPTYGTVVSEFNALKRQMGIVIKNYRNTLVNSVADGVIIYAGVDAGERNTIIIQHPGNLISIYKYNEQLLKIKGDKVKGGEPIAKMGNNEKSQQEGVLYFELWYNGVPVNPLDYIVIK